MSFNFKQSAQESTLLSKLMGGRDKLMTDDIAGKRLTIMEFDIATIENSKTGKTETYPVLVFQEYPDHYYNAGAAMMDVCTNWISAFDGDIGAASDALKESGGVTVIFTQTKTRSGNDFTSAFFPND